MEVIASHLTKLLRVFSKQQKLDLHEYVPETSVILTTSNKVVHRSKRDGESGTSMQRGYSSVGCNQNTIL